MANGTITLNMVYDAVNKLAQKIEEIDAEIHRLSAEQMAPEFKLKLRAMEKEKGKVFKSMNEFDAEFS